MADKGRAWTVQPGDTLVRGECPVEIARSAAKELDRLDDVLTVATVDVHGFDSKLAHLEVGGR